jgi:hypothetical protein
MSISLTEISPKRNAYRITFKVLMVNRVCDHIIEHNFEAGQEQDVEI